MYFLDRIFKINRFTWFEDLDEIPIHNFRKLLETGELKYMVSSGVAKKSNHFQVLNDKFEHLYNQYLQHFDHGKWQKRIMKLEEKIANLICKRWLNNDERLQIRIEIEQERLKQLKQKIENQDQSTFEESVAVIQKHMKVAFDPRKTSAKQYYTYVNMHQAEQDRLIHEQRKSKMNVR